MSRQVAFPISNDRMVQVPVADVVAVEDDRPGQSCIVVTLTQRYRCPVPRAQIEEALAEPPRR